MHEYLLCFKKIFRSALKAIDYLSFGDKIVEIIIELKTFLDKMLVLENSTSKALSAIFNITMHAWIYCSSTNNKSIKEQNGIYFKINRTWIKNFILLFLNSTTKWCTTWLWVGEIILFEEWKIFVFIMYVHTF